MSMRIIFYCNFIPNKEIPANKVDQIDVLDM
jgi:hypothetical protein